MFLVIVGSYYLDTFEKFTDAFKAFWEAVARQRPRVLDIDGYFLAYQKSGGEKNPMTMNFYQARAFAWKIGLIDSEGVLQKIEEPAREVIEEGFALATAERGRDLDAAMIIMLAGAGGGLFG